MTSSSKRESGRTVDSSTGLGHGIRCAPRCHTKAVAAQGYPPLALPSGAGHDAVVISAIAPAAMLFVRCKGGISHNPAESVEAADVAVAIETLGQFVELLAEQG